MHEHLTAWKSAQAPKTRQAATLSDSLSTALAQEIEQHASSARAEAEERALDAEQTADELAKTGTALEAEIDAFKAQLSVLSDENETLTQQRDDAQKITEQLTQDLDRERATKEALMLELAELRHQAKTQQQQLDREVQKREEVEKDMIHPTKRVSPLKKLLLCQALHNRDSRTSLVIAINN
ncbi:hypothetical protein HLB35_16120 [Halomonas sp. TBZ9]|uniref:KfrA N-terminal DNA-binding domain-containing protein n=1 Tax=Vreelandella azerica TaxID=2732867 RepID=A0A7Y3TZG2_9GAMM|nr:hypothetical protein [Halomonas azerica]NOG32915.1 hypothetical protein [Halomonas azerica]